MEEIPRLPMKRLPPISENPNGLVAIIIAAIIGAALCWWLFAWLVS